MLRTYAVLVHGFWSNYLWTTPNIHDLLSLLELAIHQKFLFIMIPHPPSDMEQVFPYPLVAFRFVILTPFIWRIINFHMSCLIL